MPYKTAAGARHKGWWHDQINGRIVAVFNGTEIFDYDGDDLAITQPPTVAARLTVSGANDIRLDTGNYRAGAVSAFATTEPTSAIVFKAGTAFAGAIATSGGLQSSATVVTKIIAAGTVSNVET